MRARASAMTPAVLTLLLAVLGPSAPAASVGGEPPAERLQCTPAAPRPPPARRPLLFAGPPGPSGKGGASLLGAPPALCARPRLLGAVTVTPRPLPLPRAAGCAWVRRCREAVAVAAEARGGGGKQSPRPPGRSPPATEVAVGVPVPVAVWDELLRVWIAGSSGAKRGLGRMAARSPLMAISFPVRRAGEQASAAAQEIVDAAAGRVAEKIAALPSFELALGKVDCVPGAGGGWSVVVEVGESAGLARLREELSLLLPESGSTTLFATAKEDGFVARLELANFRMRAEAYAARERLTAATVPPDSADASAPAADDAESGTRVGAALFRNGTSADIRWAVTSVVISAVPGDASAQDSATSVGYSRVMPLRGADAAECEQEFQALVSSLAPLPPGPKKGKGTAGGKNAKQRANSVTPDREELRVLKAVMGDFDTDFNENMEVLACACVRERMRASELASCCCCPQSVSAPAHGDGSPILCHTFHYPPIWLDGQRYRRVGPRDGVGYGCRVRVVEENGLCVSTQAGLCCRPPRTCQCN